MRIVRLQLEAFGPFSDRALDFGGASDPGLCVVYGPNEAGKSSALRAIRGLLYGIPHQSEDNFLHRHQDLRIGAGLSFQDGFAGEVVRRKGTKQTLMGQGEGGALAVERLQSLTQAVPENVFSHLYGLDHKGLVEGSRSLLEDGGELGRALFGAGLGIVHLRQLIDALEGEAQALFVPRGKIQRIAAAVAEWKQLQSQLRDSALDPGRYEEQASVVAGLEGRLASHEVAIEATRAELSRCRRLKEARQALSRAEDERRDVLARIARESEREASLVLAPGILAALEPIEFLHQTLGAYREIRQQLPRREEAVASFEAEIASLSMSLGTAWDDEREPVLRRIVERARRVRELVKDAARFEDRLETAFESERVAQAGVERLAREAQQNDGGPAESGRDPEALARALSRAQKLASIDVQLDELLRQRLAIDEACARTEQQLALGQWTADRLETLALPSVALVELHARRHAEHAEQGVRLAQRHRALIEERLAAAEELGRLRGEGSLPSEAELEAERRERDALWLALRDRWLSPATFDSSEEDMALAARYEARVRSVDQLADRLRSQADRVARGAALLAQTARLDAAIAELEGEETRREVERGGLEAAWRAVWPEAFVAAEGPGEPEARIEWRERVDELFALYARRRELETAVGKERATRGIAVRAIREALGGVIAGIDDDERLEGWIERGEIEYSRRMAEQAEARDRAQAREQAKGQLERAVHDRENAEAQLERWRASWREELTVSSLPVDSAPRDAEAHLDTIQRLLDRQGKLAEAQVRVDKMRADARRFETECRRLVACCLPEIPDLRFEGEAEPAALRLKRELDRAREQATRADALRLSIAEARDQLDVSERRCASCAEALRELAGTAFEASDPTLDLDQLEARIATLEERLGQQGDERTRTFGALQLQRSLLEAMDGNARQADLAEQAEARRAQVLVDVRRYAELVLARQILEQEIEAYRRANQGPLLEHAGRIFSELTRGAYPTILSDVGDDGRARLVALNADRREVTVEALSNGTRDQLFFALRLATLAASLDRAEPMPLVADDILIEFDDERTRATLEVLARFGERTQILLFSHHRHVADLAEALGGAARVVEL